MTQMNETAVLRDVSHTKILFILTGISCILPFLPVYMHQLGLTVAETGLIRSLEPLISFLASPLWGFLADKYSKHKLTLIISIIGSGVLTFGIVFIPRSETSDANDYHDSVHENVSAIESILNDSWTWSLNCSSPDWTRSSFCCDTSQSDCSRSDVCTEFCNATKLMAKEIPSHTYMHCSFCTLWELQNVRTPKEPNATTQRTDVNLTHSLRVYCLQDNVTRNLFKSNASCSEETGDLCAPLLNQIDSRDRLHECVHWEQCTCSNLTALRLPPAAPVSSTLVFTLFIVLILSSKIFLCNVFPIMDATVMLTLSAHPQDYGRQRLWGSIGWGSFGLISGAAIDLISKNSSQTNFNPAFYIFIGLTTISVVASLFIPSPPHKANKKMVKNFCGLLMQANVVTFLLVVFVVGMSFGISGTFLFLFLEELNSPHILMGMTLTLSSISEVLCLFFAGRIIKKITYIGVAYLTLICYAVRFLGYSLISNPCLCFHLKCCMGLRLELSGLLVHPSLVLMLHREWQPHCKLLFVPSMLE